jgi:hypothetical protein
MAETPRRERTAPSEGGKPAADPFGFAPEVSLRFGQAMMESLGEQQRQFFDFVTHRLKTDAELQQRLIACTSPAGMVEVWSEFARTAVQEYADHVSQVQKTLAETMSRATASKS